MFSMMIDADTHEGVCYNTLQTHSVARTSSKTATVEKLKFVTRSSLCSLHEVNARINVHAQLRT